MEEPINKNPRVGNDRMITQTNELDKNITPQNKEQLLGSISSLTNNLAPDQYGEIYNLILNKVEKMKKSNLPTTMSELKKIVKSVIKEAEVTSAKDYISRFINDIVSASSDDWLTITNQYGISRFIKSPNKFEKLQDWLKSQQTTIEQSPITSPKELVMRFSAISNIGKSKLFADKPEKPAKPEKVPSGRKYWGGIGDDSKRHLRFVVNLKDIGPRLAEYIDNLPDDEKEEIEEEFLELRKSLKKRDFMKKPVPRGVAEGNPSSVQTYIRKYIDAPLAQMWAKIIAPKATRDQAQEEMLKEENVLALYQVTLDYFGIDPVTVGKENEIFVLFLKATVKRKIMEHLQNGMLTKDGQSYSEEMATSEDFSDSLESAINDFATGESALKDFFYALYPLFEQYDPITLYGWMSGKVEFEELESKLKDTVDINEYDPMFDQESTNSALFDAYFDILQSIGLDSKVDDLEAEKENLQESFREIEFLLKNKKLTI